MFLRTIAISALAIGAFAQVPNGHARSATLHRAADRGYLGVGVIEMTPNRARELKLPNENGVEVKRVDEESPASKAGLKENDVILEVNGKAVEQVETFIRPIAEGSTGTKVNLTVWRNNAKMAVVVTLESRPTGAMFVDPADVMPPFPDVPQTRNGQPSSLLGQSQMVGFEGETLTDQLAQFFGVKEGVLVRTVAARTPAEKAGLRAGDVVVKVNGTPVTSPREISGIVNSSRKKSLTFTVVRNKKEVQLDVELASLHMPASDHEDM